MSVADRVYARALYEAALERARLRCRRTWATSCEAVAGVPQLRVGARQPAARPGVEGRRARGAAAGGDELVRNFLLLLAEKGRVAGSTTSRARSTSLVAARRAS